MWFKAIVFGIGIFAIYIFIKNVFAPKEIGEKDAQSLLECDSCNTFFAKSDGFRLNGKSYCSKECANRSKGA